MSKAIQFKRNGENIYPCPYYPVGSIYLSVNNTNPGTIFGGTWQQISGYYLYACASSESAGTTFGSSTSGSTALTVNQLPAHTHGRKTLTGQWRSKKARFPGSSERSGIITEWEVNQSTYWSSGGGTDTNTVGWKIDASHEHDSVGNNEGHTHSITPPGYRVYAWKRTG